MNVAGPQEPRCAQPGSIPCGVHEAVARIREPLLSHVLRLTPADLLALRLKGVELVAWMCHS